MNALRLAASVAVLVVLTSCSGGDEPQLGEPVDIDPPETSVGSESGEPDVVASSSTAPGSDRDIAGGTEPQRSSTSSEPVEGDSARTDTGQTDTAQTDTAQTEPDRTEPAQTEPAENQPAQTETDRTGPASTAPIETVPETGVAGLESEDRFCAAWSRFGGTWQVLIVGSQFLEDPDRVSRWEIAAAPVIADAYDELIETLPPEAAGESAAVVDGFFGALARRSEVAGAALQAAGATDDQIDALAERWVDALGTRSNDSPAVQLELDAELEPLVAAAAADFRGRRVPIHTDPSMFITVQTPATDAYIADTCPDQGTLSGEEVDP